MKNRKRNRKLGYDYSKDNLYFVTICVKNRICCFGEIDNKSTKNSQLINENKKKILQLNTFGEIAYKQWVWLANQYSYVSIPAFVVMPNHVHAIVEINSEKAIGNCKIKSLSQLIGAYKTTSSKLIHLKGLGNFVWQRSFHDHIIRNETSYSRIYNYIITNPERWKTDSFNA